MNFKLLIIDDIDVYYIKAITQAYSNVEVVYMPNILPQEAKAVVNDYDILVVRSKLYLDQYSVTNNTRLKLIARAGAGVDNIDTTYLNSLNISIINAPEGNSNAVSEHAMGMLLALLNNLFKANEEVKQGVWLREANRGQELAGKTVGLIGYGNNGKATAKKLHAFDAKVLVYDKYLTHYTDEYATESSMQNLYQQADIISFHIPLTTETEHLLNQDFIDKMAKPFIFMNLSRGKTMDTNSLVKALESQKIIGACLDVLENECFETYNSHERALFNSMANSGRVLFSPHIAGWTIESYLKIAQVLAHKTIAWLQAY